MTSPRQHRRAAYEWAAQQIKKRSTVDLNRPNPSGELWFDREGFLPAVSPRAYTSHGPIQITPEMRQELRRYRLAAGVTGAFLCRRVGVAQDYVSQVESGNIRRTTAETWNELLAYCRAEIAERAAELERIQQEWAA